VQAAAVIRSGKLDYVLIGSSALHGEWYYS
jgi:hypothetical protein